MTQNFLFGIVYYSELYYLPIYYQNVRGWNPLIAAALTIPLVVSQSLTSILSGLYISKTKRYGGVIWLGYILWIIGTSLKCTFNRKTHPAVIASILILEGCGIGCVFQPSMTGSVSMVGKAAKLFPQLSWLHRHILQRPTGPSLSVFGISCVHSVGPAGLHYQQQLYRISLEGTFRQICRRILPTSSVLRHTASQTCPHYLMSSLMGC